MNTKTKFLAIGIGALTALNFSSCSDYSEFTEAEIKHDVKMKEFYDNFVKEFGEPDPNHTWGWGMTPEMAHEILGDQLTTRALGNPYDQGGAINTNVNQWTEDNQTALKKTVHVPGWPNDDGRYYVKSGTYNDAGTYNRYATESDAMGKGNAMGDVTEYEIQWVSRYVRSKTIEQLQDKSVLLHMSEFFIQQVSTDYDYNSDGTIRSYGNNYKEYQMDKLDFQSLTGAWTHINNFNAYMNLAPQNPEHIGKNSARNIMYVMSSGTEDFQYHPSNSTESWFRKFVLIELTWTEPVNPDWTKVTNGTYTLDQVLDNPTLLGETITRTGYYLCFDYQSSKLVEGWSYDGDDVYSNWILKLTPGKYHQRERWPKRLMCEDLGNTYDFDFNDAVFDLIFQSNTTQPGHYDCVVTIQAAGGTMPIWVGLDYDKMSAEDKAKTEIHNLLGGNSSKTPVNVIQGGTKAMRATYRVKDLFSSTEASTTWTTDAHGNRVIDENPAPTNKLMSQMAAAAFLLKIYIQTPSGIRTVSGEQIFKSLRNGLPSTEPPYQAGYNDGNKGTNALPQLFNCSTDAKWTYENGHFGNAYKHFVDWVHNEQGDYRLRWDRNEYYSRNTGEQTGTVTLIPHFDSDRTSWLGSWDFGPKGATEWGSDGNWIDKSKCWGGNGPE